MKDALELTLASGDVIVVRVTDDGFLLSIDDCDRTLKGPDGRPGVPTVKLSDPEAAYLSGHLFGMLSGRGSTTGSVEGD